MCGHVEWSGLAGDPPAGRPGQTGGPQSGRDRAAGERELPDPHQHWQDRTRAPPGSAEDAGAQVRQSSG